MDVLRTIMDEIEHVVANVKKDEIDQVIGLIQKDRRIFVAGEGRSGFSAKGFAMRLMHLGYTVYVVGETITPAIKEGDILIGVSGSGKSISVVDAARKAKEKNASVIAVTSKRESPLAGFADQILVIDEGKVVQHGRHEELSQEEGIYKTIYEKQLLEAEIDQHPEHGGEA